MPDCFRIGSDCLKSVKTCCGRLEESRIGKQIGSSLEARVDVAAAGAAYDLLQRYHDQLRYLFIVSQAEVSEFRMR